MTAKSELITLYCKLFHDDLWYGHLRRKMRREGKTDSDEYRRVCDLEMHCVKTKIKIGDIIENHFKDGRDLLCEEATRTRDSFVRYCGFSTWEEYVKADLKGV